MGIYSVSVPRKILNEIDVFIVYEPEKGNELNTKPWELLLLNKAARILWLVSCLSVYGSSI